MAECDGLNCGHGAPLDITALIARFGAGHIVINETRIKRRLRCRSCNHIGCSLRLIPYSIKSDGQPLYMPGNIPE